MTLLPTTAYAECKIEGKKVLMVIASKNFADTEYLTPRKILEMAGAHVVVASKTTAAAKGMSGTIVKPDISLKDANMRNFSAVIFVGGSGANQYWSDEEAINLIRNAANAGKLIAGICLAPVTLGNAGVLKGKKATVWPSERQRLEKMGVNVVDSPVIVDGNIITGKNPQAAEAFGEAIKERLCK